MRDYGLPLLVWGGEEGCEHEWATDGAQTRAHREWSSGERTASKGGISSRYDGKFDSAPQGSFCHKCGAWLGSLGLEPTPELYIEHIVEVFREVRRVLRDDGTLWLNMGSSYWGGKGKSGYELPHEAEERRTKGETFQRAHNVPGYMDMRPADGRHPVFKPKDLVPIPWMVAMALQADGWWLRSDIIWAKPNCMPESVRDRPTKAHEYVFLLVKSKRYYYDQDAIREPHTRNWGKEAWTHTRKDSLGAKNGKAAFVPKYGEVSNVHRGDKTLGETYNPAGRNKRTVWTIPTHPFPEAHFATFPPKLVEPMIKAGTSERGACPECGKAWVRVTKRLTPSSWQARKAGGAGSIDWHVIGQQSKHGIGVSHDLDPPNIETIGWQPACECQNKDAVQIWDDPRALANAPPFDPIPCLVLDPFAGAGTTSLVAEKLGRDSVLIDLSPEYAEMSKQRILEELGPMFTKITMEGMR